MYELYTSPVHATCLTYIMLNDLIITKYLVKSADY